MRSRELIITTKVHLDRRSMKSLIRSFIDSLFVGDEPPSDWKWTLHKIDPDLLIR